MSRRTRESAGPVPWSPAVTFPERSRRSVGAVARMLGALVLLLVGLSVPIGILARKPIDPLALFGVLAAVLGLLIARRQPGNRIALLLTGFGALLVCYENAARYAVADYNVHHGTLPLGFPAVLIASELWSGLFLMPPLIILLFPDGTLPRRWRMVAWAYLARWATSRWASAYSACRCASPSRSRSTTCTT